MFHILGLDHVVLRVKDLARMSRFYCEVLGCEVERARPERGLIQLRAGASLIDLTAETEPDKTVAGDQPSQPRPLEQQLRNMDHLCLRIEPFDQNALVAHLAANGAAPGEIRSRFGADGYGPSLYLHDPEGNKVELKGAPGSAAG